MIITKQSGSSLVKVLLLLIIFNFSFLTSLAQPDPEYQRLTISGQLLDADLKEPMVQATIQLFTVTDSTFVGGAVSNERGNFIVQAPTAGTFRLRTRLSSQ